MSTNLWKVSETDMRGEVKIGYAICRHHLDCIWWMGSRASALRAADRLNRGETRAVPHPCGTGLLIVESRTDACSLLDSEVN